MAEGVNANIFLALVKRLEDLAFTPPLPISYPRITFPPEGEEKPTDYLEINFIPNRTLTRSLHAVGRQQFLGIFQVSVHYGSGSGIGDPMQIADKIIDHFPLGLPLNEGGVRVKIHRKPYQSPAISGPDTMMIPVTIEYIAFHQ